MTDEDLRIANAVQALDEVLARTNHRVERIVIAYRTERPLSEPVHCMTVNTVNGAVRIEKRHG